MIHSAIMRWGNCAAFGDRDACRKPLSFVVHMVCMAQLAIDWIGRISNVLLTQTLKLPQSSRNVYHPRLRQEHLILLQVLEERLPQLQTCAEKAAF